MIAIGLTISIICVALDVLIGTGPVMLTLFATPGYALLGLLLFILLVLEVIALIMFKKVGWNIFLLVLGILAIIGGGGYLAGGIIAGSILLLIGNNTRSKTNLN